MASRCTTTILILKHDPLSDLRLLLAVACVSCATAGCRQPPGDQTEPTARTTPAEHYACGSALSEPLKGPFGEYIRIAVETAAGPAIVYSGGVARFDPIGGLQPIWRPNAALIDATAVSGTETVFAATRNQVTKLNLTDAGVSAIPCGALVVDGEVTTIAASPQLVAVSVAEADFGRAHLMISDLDCQIWRETFQADEGQLYIDYAAPFGLWMLRSRGLGGGSSLWTATASPSDFQLRASGYPAFRSAFAESPTSLLVGGEGALRRITMVDDGGSVQAVSGPADVTDISAGEDAGFWIASFVFDGSPPLKLRETAADLTARREVVAGEDEFVTGMSMASGLRWLGGTRGLVVRDGTELLRPSTPFMSSELSPVAGCNGSVMWTTARAEDGLLNNFFEPAPGAFWRRPSNEGLPKAGAPLWGPFELENSALYWGVTRAGMKTRLLAETTGADGKVLFDEPASDLSGPLLRVAYRLRNASRLLGSAPAWMFEFEYEGQPVLLRATQDAVSRLAAPPVPGTTVAAIDPYSPHEVTWVTADGSQLVVRSTTNGGEDWSSTVANSTAAPRFGGVDATGNPVWLDVTGSICDASNCRAVGGSRLWTVLRASGDTAILVQSPTQLTVSDSVFGTEEVLIDQPVEGIRVFGNVVVFKLLDRTWRQIRVQ